jgi:hypothetical protein
MRSRQFYVQPSGAKRNWTQREWHLYVEMPWLVRRIVDVMMYVPRFVKAPALREAVDRRDKFVARRMLESKRRRRAF